MLRAFGRPTKAPASYFIAGGAGEDPFIVLPLRPDEMVRELRGTLKTLSAHVEQVTREKQGRNLPLRHFRGEVMKRSYFFWAATIIGGALGLLMFLSPATAAQGFGVVADPIGQSLFRVLGATLIGIAILNFMVRDHPASPTLNAILWGNAAIHLIGSVADIWSVLIGTLTWANIAPGLVIHLVIFVWALWLLLRPSAA